MARFASLILLTLAAGCGQNPEPSSQTWSSGRDGLCLAGDEGALRGGLLVYGQGNANCSVSGSIVRDGTALRLTPAGDTACTVDIALEGDRAVIGARSAACAYYCGPTADYSGKSLAPSDKAPSAVTDLAGDPLC